LPGAYGILQSCGNVLLAHNRIPRVGSVLSCAYDKLLRHICAKMKETAGFM
jgi:hypothetical protein